MKIKEKEFNRIVKETKGLTPKQKEYVKGVFQDSLKRGMSKGELKKDLYDLKKDYNDPVDRSEVDKVKRGLMEHFENKD